MTPANWSRSVRSAARAIACAVALIAISAPSRSSFAADGDAAATLLQADLVVPPGAAGPARLAGKWKDVAAADGSRAKPVPVVIMLHGSGGLSAATKEFQDWLALQGVASVAPDSFARPNRLTYKSPASKQVYELIHAQRAQEIEQALSAVQQSPWADKSKIFLAGTSEGSVAVARWDKSGFAGRLIFSWSCEDNYFVDSHRTASKPDEPLLNVISLTDPYFSPASPLAAGGITGHCGSAMAQDKAAQIVLIPGAPHTLYNLPQVRSIVKSFLDLYAFQRR